MLDIGTSEQPGTEAKRQRTFLRDILNRGFAMLTMIKGLCLIPVLVLVFIISVVYEFIEQKGF